MIKYLEISFSFLADKLKYELQLY